MQILLSGEGTYTLIIFCVVAGRGPVLLLTIETEYLKLIIMLLQLVVCSAYFLSVGTMLTCHTMDAQLYSIGKAIRPLFADPVTYVTVSKYIIFALECSW